MTATATAPIGVSIHTLWNRPNHREPPRLVQRAASDKHSLDQMVLDQFLRHCKAPGHTPRALGHQLSAANLLAPNREGHGRPGRCRHGPDSPPAGTRAHTHARARAHRDTHAHAGTRALSVPWQAPATEGPEECAQCDVRRAAARLPMGGGCIAGTRTRSCPAAVTQAHAHAPTVEARMQVASSFNAAVPELRTRVRTAATAARDRIGMCVEHTLTWALPETRRCPHRWLNFGRTR